MRNYLQKCMYALLVMLGVVILVFIMFQGLGDPARLILGQSGDKKTMDNIRHELHLDEPKWKQCVLYLNDVSPVSFYKKTTIEERNMAGIFLGGNTKLAIKWPYFGKSYQSKKNTSGILAEALAGTVVLALTAMLFASIIGIGLGMLSAVFKDTWIDQTAIFASIAGISAPSFFMAILIAYFFGIVLHPYTGLNFTGSLFAMDEVTGERYLVLKNLILPAFTLGIRPLSIITQLTRSSLLDVLGQDYIRTAYAKGLSKPKVVFRHALRNALNPVVTAITGWFAELLGGAFFVEYIFGWKGLGKVTVDALEKLDYPVVMGSVVVSAFVFICVNILADVFYKLNDPRIRV